MKSKCLARGYSKNKWHKNALVLLQMAAGFGTILAGQAETRVFTTLHGFAAGSTNSSGVYTNSDGAGPYGRLVLLGGALFGGVTDGTNGSGAIFKINADGTGFTNLYSFTATVGTAGASGLGTNSDGAVPGGGLLLSGNVFYGGTGSGGANGNGTVFRINVDGTAFTNLYDFSAGNTNLSGVYTNSDGAGPSVNLIQSDSAIYGSAFAGGANGNGAIFKLNLDGSGFTNLYSFSAGATNSIRAYTNSDGISPTCLIVSGNILYGTAFQGGSAGWGTVFAIDTNGNGFTNLHNFTGHFSDGIYPFSGVIIAGDMLYGTTFEGGNGHGGTVFSMSTNGTGFTNLHNFTNTNVIAVSPHETNSDGLYPVGGLVLSNGTLYGTTIMGGPSGTGTVFAVNEDGTGFASLYSFSSTVGNTGFLGGDGANSDGFSPQPTLVLSGNTLYGTAYEGGAAGNGTVFSISFPPQLAISSSGTNVILSWPTNVGGFDYSGYTLQSTASLNPPTAWTTVSPPAVVANGANTVSNGISGTMQFYRLIR